MPRLAWLAGLLSLALLPPAWGNALVRVTDSTGAWIAPRELS